MELIGTFRNQISAPSRAAKVDVLQLRDAAVQASDAIGRLGASGGALGALRSSISAIGKLPSAGRASGSASGSTSAAGRGSSAASTDKAAQREAEKRAKETARIEAKRRADETRESARKRRELESSQKYVGAIRDRYFMSQQKQEEREAAAKEKTDQRAALRSQMTAAREAERKKKEAEKTKAAEQKQRERDAKDAERANKKGGGAPKSEKSKVAGAADAASSKAMALAKFAAVGLGASAIGQLALGYRGMERLAGISARARLNFRSLFSGVNPKPILDVYERFTLLFSKQTVAGRALAGIFERTFNGLGAGLKSAEPFILDFVKGLTLGALDLEILWLRARIALYPLTSAVGDFFNKIGVGATLGEIAFIGLALKATGLLGVLLKAGGAAARLGTSLLTAGSGASAVGGAASGAAGGAGGAMGAAGTAGAIAALFIASLAAGGWLRDKYDDSKTKDNDEKLGRLDAGEERSANGKFLRYGRNEKTGKFEAIESDTRTARSSLGRIGFADMLAKAASAAPANGAAPPGSAAPALDLKDPTQSLGSLAPGAGATGKAIGTMLGAGIVLGMKDAEPLVEAGGASLASAADKGARSPKGGDIRSPSRKTTRVGMYLGQGVVVGMKSQEAAVQSTAERALVPDLGGMRAGGGGVGMAGTGRAQVVINVGGVLVPNYVGTREELSAFIEDATREIFDNVAKAMGI